MWVVRKFPSSGEWFPQLAACLCAGLHVMLPDPRPNGLVARSCMTSDAHCTYSADSMLTCDMQEHNTWPCRFSAITRLRYVCFAFLCRSTFHSNHAGAGGGASMNIIRGLTVDNCSFTDNTAALLQPDATQCSVEKPGGGGALCIEATDVSAAFTPLSLQCTGSQ